MAYWQCRSGGAIRTRALAGLAGLTPAHGTARECEDRLAIDNRIQSLTDPEVARGPYPPPCVTALDGSATSSEALPVATRETATCALTPHGNTQGSAVFTRDET